MEKVSKEIFNVKQENIEKLKQIFPSAIKDGQLDVKALKEELGTFEEVGQEKYEMNWAGKQKAKQIAQTLPLGKTLKYVKGDGINEDTTENIYIEGDNLEVLKLLRKNYYGSIKMIYIDPPYNTGNDFVYKDDFGITQQQVETVQGQRTEEGEKLQKNTKEGNAKYHTNWLNMMYPRLKLAKDLLTDNGSIFISIDYNEFANMKKLMDEIFDEQNFQREIIWRIGWLSGYKTTAPNFIRNHDTILFYSKNNTNFSFNKEYLLNKDFKPLVKKEPKLNQKLEELGLNKKQQDDLLNFINHENRTDKYPLEDTWNCNEYDDLNSIAIVSFSGEKISKILEINQEFKGQKSVKMLQRLIRSVTSKDDIILDFFAGTASTAHAVMQQNSEDNGNRKYIMVQIPEHCDSDSEAYKAGYKNICEIGKERIRRSGKKIQQENPDKKTDIGFKVFKVADTTLNWEKAALEGKDLYSNYNENDTEKDKLDFTPGFTDLDVVYEIMLRQEGLSLTSKIENLTDIGQRTFLVENSYLICLEENITEEIIKKLSELEPLPIKFVFRDSAFNDDIALKDESFRRLSALIDKNKGAAKQTYTIEFI
ncbi:MAG: site-specific DNA-methyltransferase [Endomicrobiaceae bacterium]|nr:site-specific DNA-methyltransferase [Endomicrobiaceae bacterium]